MTDQTGAANNASQNAPNAERTAASEIAGKSAKLTALQEQAFAKFNGKHELAIGTRSVKGDVPLAVANSLKAKGLIDIVGRIDIMGRRPGQHSYSAAVLTDAGRSVLSSSTSGKRQPEQPKPWQLSHDDLRKRSKQLLGVLRDARQDDAHPRDIKAIKKEAKEVVAERLRRHVGTLGLMRDINRTKAILAHLKTDVNNGFRDQNIEHYTDELARFQGALRLAREKLPQRRKPVQETKRVLEGVNMRLNEIKKAHQGDTQ